MKVNVSPIQQKVGILTGGIRQDKPQLELAMGDLIRGVNYQEVDGTASGYKSINGYEVFDGSQLASEVALEFDVNEDYDDTNREAARDLITKVGDADGANQVRGVFDFNGVVYATRNSGDASVDKLWSSSALGWVEVPGTTSLTYSSGDNNSGTEISIGEVITGSVSSATGTVVSISLTSGSWAGGDAAGIIVVISPSDDFEETDIISNASGATADITITTEELPKDGNYKFIEARFDLLADMQRESVCMFVSDKYYPSYIRDGVFVPILHPALPDDATNGIFATSIIEFKNRLWLGYSDGRVVFSNVGDPHDFDASTFSGTIYLNDEVVDFAITKGDALVVFCKNSIQIIKALSTSDITDQVVTDYLFSNITLTDDVGAVENTARVVLDDVFYIDDRGLSSITATDSYGDFENKSYSKSINKTLLLNYDKIIGATVDKEKNQYRLFFNNGFGIIFTFTTRQISSTRVKAIKGATLFKYLVNPSCVTDGYFGSTDGYVYKYDSGTSFNGENIETTLQTSYHHYGSPGFIKRFREITIEGEIPYRTSFDVQINFDYRNIGYIPPTDFEDFVFDTGMGGVFGEGIYGQIFYGGSENQSTIYQINAYGTNMSLALYSSNKYTEPHILSNITTQYSINGRKM